MPQPYKSPTCRGSFALGSACGSCEKCRDTLAEVFPREELAAKPQPGLPVAGYKPTQPPHLIALVNENKILEERTLRQIERHKAMGGEIDQRSVALAYTQIQEAFMWLNRGVFQPARIQGDLD